MPRVRLHAYKARYDFFNVFRVDSAKFTQITLNEVFPWVLVVGRIPGGSCRIRFRSNSFEPEATFPNTLYQPAQSGDTVTIPNMGHC